MTQPYDSRAATAAPMNRAMAAPQYIPHSPYSSSAEESMILPHQEITVHQHFNFASFQNPNINMLVPELPETYIQSRPLPRLTHSEVDGRRSYASNSQQSYVDEYHGQTSPVKHEQLWSPTAGSPASRAGKTKSKTTSPVVTDAEPAEVTFDTEVDTLMRAIQAKSQATPGTQDPVEKPASHITAHPSAYSQAVEVAGSVHDSKDDAPEDPKNGKRRYKCQNCMKSFYQKTHLDIHERSHTGFKPYVSCLMLFQRS